MSIFQQNQSSDASSGTTSTPTLNTYA
jgi:hypothetical protein